MDIDMQSWIHYLKYILLTFTGPFGVVILVIFTNILALTLYIHENFG